MALKRRFLFTVCDSKDMLHDWIETYLGFDIPDSIVDETSNSTPMSAIWEIYDRCRRNDEEGFRRILSYASRMSFKTLSAAILEILMVFHLGRSVAHMAAIEPQAKKCQEYVKKFLRMPPLRDFTVGSNQRRVDIVRYRHLQTGDYLSPKEWDRLSQPDQDRYEQVSHYIAIVICTMAGANSEHVPFFVVDEVDVVQNPAAYEEARAIPDVFEGKLPVTLLTSTRKISFGLVQKEIDRAKDNDLQIRHWNILDVTERCPEKRHRPDLPKLPIYRSDDTLRALSEGDYQNLTVEQQVKYVKDEGYAGCLLNCKLFAVCKGRLATHQNSASSLLKKIVSTQGQFADFSPEMAKAQLLCWKPSTEGLIYPRLDPTVHYKTAAQIAEMVTGEPYSQRDKKMSKADLLALLKSRDVQWFAGMDFGFTHNFAVVIGCRDGARMFVLDVIAEKELDLGQQVEVCERRLRQYGATVFADTAQPQNIKTLRRQGFRMRDWDKYKGSVVGGIEVVRLKLWPAMGQPQLFFLAEDEGVGFLFERLCQYHWKIDAAGVITDEPDDEDDDECDALRYMVMNVFAPKGKVTVAKAEEGNPLAAPRQTPGQQEVQRQHWQQIMEHVGVSTDGDPAPESGTKKGKKGSFHWQMG